jgi:hypothetical protein
MLEDPQPRAALRIRGGRDHGRHSNAGERRAELRPPGGRGRAVDRSELKPPRGDRRFLDPAWSASWIYRRLLQAHLAVDETVDGVIGDAELDWADDRKLRFIAQNIVDALAPANAPLINP